MRFIDYLTDEDYKLGRILHFEKNTIIKNEQDECHELYFVIKGEIKISSYQLNGEEDIFNNVKEGDIFANNLVFSQNNKYLGNIIALKDTILLEFTKDNLLLLLSHNLKFLNAYCSYYAESIIQEKLKIKLLAKKSIEERLCYYLSMNNGEVTISIQALANILFLQRPSLARVVSSLIKEGVIKKEGKKITLLKYI